MNEDLISRSALLERLDKVAMPDDLYSLGIQRGVEHAKEVIAEAPAVDAEKVCEQMGLVKEAMDMAKAYLRPVRHGRWIISSDGYYPYCWDCKARPKGGNMTKYCPNCGAKMDGDFE